MWKKWYLCICIFMNLKKLSPWRLSTFLSSKPWRSSFAEGAHLLKDLRDLEFPCFLYFSAKRLWRIYPMRHTLRYNNILMEQYLNDVHSFTLISWYGQSVEELCLVEKPTNKVWNETEQNIAEHPTISVLFYSVRYLLYR